MKCRSLRSFLRFLPKRNCAVTTIPSPQSRASSITSRIQFAIHARFLCYSLVEEFDALSCRRARTGQEQFSG